MTRKQMASGIALGSQITAAVVDEQRETSHPIGFCQGRSEPKQDRSRRGR